MKPAEFSEALTRARAGEEAGFAALYSWFAPEVYGFLRGRIPGEAEDLSASTWLDVARGIGRFEGDAAGFRAWIFTIARRRMMNERRRQARRPVDLHPPETLPEPAAIDAESLVLEGLTADDAVALINRVLPGLAGEVVLLRVIADLSVNQIAEVLDLAPGHVRVLSHRGLRTLARHFSSPAVTHPAGPGMTEVP